MQKLLPKGFKNYCKKVAKIIIKRFQKTSVKRLQKQLPKGCQHNCARVSGIIGKGWQNNWRDVARTSTYTATYLTI